MPPLAQNCNYIPLYLSTIATTQDYTPKMPKTCYHRLNFSVILQICIDHTFSCMHFCKKKHTQEGHATVHFFKNHNYQGGTGKFIYKTLI